MNKIAIFAALCSVGAVSGIAQAQDAMMNDGMMMAPTMMAPTMMMAPAPTATVIRRYTDSAGNLSAVDVRFSSGMGTGQTRQLRIMPALVVSSEAATPYGLGRVLTIGVSDDSVMAPPSFDPDASPDTMRGVIAPAGNTTPGMPSLGLTNEEMIAGGYKSGSEPKM